MSRSLTTVPLAMAVDSAIRVVLYVVEVTAAVDIPTEIESSASVAILGIVLYFIPTKGSSE